MSAVMSSSLRSWYADSQGPDSDPGEPRLLTGTFQTGSIFHSPDGKPLGIVQGPASFSSIPPPTSIAPFPHVTIQVVGDQMRASLADVAKQIYSVKLESFGDSVKAISNAFKTFFPENDPIPEYETVRERALRLKKQPHSMTTDKQYDRRGRKRSGNR